MQIDGEESPDGTTAPPVTVFQSDNAPALDRMREARLEYSRRERSSSADLPRQPLARR